MQWSLRHNLKAHFSHGCRHGPKEVPHENRMLCDNVPHWLHVTAILGSFFFLNVLGWMNRNRTEAQLLKGQA